MVVILAMKLTRSRTDQKAKILWPDWNIQDTYTFRDILLFCDSPNFSNKGPTFQTHGDSSISPIVKPFYYYRWGFRWRCLAIRQRAHGHHWSCRGKHYISDGKPAAYFNFLLELDPSQLGIQTSICNDDHVNETRLNVQIIKNDYYSSHREMVTRVYFRSTLLLCDCLEGGLLSYYH